MTILIPDDIRAKLLANGRVADADHVPLVKLTLLGTDCIWLLSELQPYDEDIAFGLCDLGLGFPEIGPVSLSEIEQVAEHYNTVVLRDPAFEGRYPLSVYAEAANIHQAITTRPSLLEAAARRMAARRRDSGRD